MKELIKDNIIKFLEQSIGTTVTQCEQIMGSASKRLYFRLGTTYNISYIGVYNERIEENKTFFHFTDVFSNNHLPVPKLIAIHQNNTMYICEDVGKDDLFTLVKNADFQWNEQLLLLFKKVLDYLIMFQLEGKKHIDFNKCYEKNIFDNQMILWDLNYFKYYFIKLMFPSPSEIKLDKDFNNILAYMAQIDNSFFMYRDFQSRNIMIHDFNPFFIDYQGGLRGPLEYDVASLLYQTRLNMPHNVSEILISHYIEKLYSYISIDEVQFRNNLTVISFIRILQNLGAYGFRGIIEKNNTFIEPLQIALQKAYTISQTCSKFIDIQYI
ncbi:MAG: hypothetical protein SNJ71_02535, partial [Bacteroidales bacterium]